MFWDGKADVGQLNMVEPLTTFVLEKDDTSSTWIICLSAFNKPE